MSDYRTDQKVIATLSLEDKFQDFTEIDVLENGVILGQSPMFSEGQLMMVGIGTLNGTVYHSFEELKAANFKEELKGLFIYMKNSGDPDPVPWEARTIKYAIESVNDAPTLPDRFIKK